MPAQIPGREISAGVVKNDDSGKLRKLVQVALIREASVGYLVKAPVETRLCPPFKASATAFVIPKANPADVEAPVPLPP